MHRSRAAVSLLTCRGAIARCGLPCRAGYRTLLTVPAERPAAGCMHAHARRTHRRTCSHTPKTPTLAHTHTDPRAHMQTHARARAHTRRRVRTRKKSRTQTRTHTRARARLRTFARTHTRSHAHTRACFVFVLFAAAGPRQVAAHAALALAARRSETRQAARPKPTMSMPFISSAWQVTMR